MDYTPTIESYLDFIAQGINQIKSKEDGYTHSTLWGTLREDLKEEYRSEAKRLVARWVESEASAKKSRDEHDSRAFFGPNTSIRP